MSSNNSAIEKLKKEKLKIEAKGQWKEIAAMCNYIGQELCKLGKYDEALQYHEEELHLCTVHNDRLGVAVANRRIGECYTELNQFSKALGYLKHFLNIANEIKSDVELQRAWATLGRTYYFKYLYENDKDLSDDFKSRSLDKAQEAYKKALELADNLKGTISAKESAEMRSRLLLNLGLVFERRKHLAECADSIRQAIYLTKKFNLYEDLHRCQYSLATIYQACEQYNYALRLLDESISSAKQLRDKNLLCEAFATKANILIMLKDFEASKTYLKKAYKMGTPVNTEREHIQKYLKCVIFLCKCKNELSFLKDDLSQRAALFEKMGDALASIECYKIAIEYYLSTLECLKKISAPAENVSSIYFSIAQTYCDLGEFKEALQYFNKEMETNAKKPIEQVKTLWKIAEINLEQGNMTEAEKIYLNALTISEKLNDKKYKYNCLKGLENFYEKSHDQEKYESIVEKLKEMGNFEGMSCDSDIETCEEDVIDINVDELSDDTDSDIEKELQDSKRPRRSLKHTDHKRNELGETPLHRACITGNFNMVKHLIENGHPVNTRDHCGWLPLHEACNYGFCDIVEYLLEKGALINDRGGKFCDGITPLHDAASCGNMDVMELLISRGALVTALNNNQETPLQCLTTWFERSKKDLDGEAIEQYKRMQSKLKSLMSQSGASIKSFAINNDQISSEVTSVSFSSKAGDNPLRVQEKRHRSPSITSDEDETSFIDPNFNLEPIKSLEDPKSARMEYEAVMASLRRSNKEKELTKNIKEPPTALVDEQTRVTDWLVEDVFPKSQKRNKRPKYPKLNVRKRNQSIQGFLVKNDSDSDSIRSNSPLPNVDIHEDNNSNDYISKHSTSSTSISKDPQPEVLISNHSCNLFRLRISVNDKVILVPVSDDTCTIAWLIDETEKRFYNLVGSKPNLSLANKDGAILSPYDLIKSTLQNNEEVLGTVISWDHPSLLERFEQVAIKNGISISEDLKQSIITFDSTYELNLSDMFLPPKELSLLVSTLKHYDILTYLNLSNTEIMRDVLQLIIDCIPSFKSLISLNLSCCGLTSASIKDISKFLSKNNTLEIYLPKLQILNISYNSFVSENANDLTVFLSLPSLEVLDISSCGITSSFFANKTFCEALEKTEHIKEFNVMGNDFKEDGILKLLMSLPKATIHKVDLSHSLLERIELGKHLHQFISMDILPFLEELHLAGCYFRQDDMLLLTDCIRFCPKLHLINLSSNPDLNIDSVIDFISNAYQFKVPLKILHATGIRKWNQSNIVSIINILCLKFLTQIVIDVVPESYQDLLFDTWKSCWGNISNCHNELVCELSIN